MFGTEISCQPKTVHQFSDVGTIEIKKKGVRVRKPAWLVLTKIVGLIGMLIVGLIFIPEKIPFFTGGQAVAASLLVILVYVVIAHFVQPKANTDNLGVLGVADDKFQYYDDINRHLLAMDVVLGPGRFIASAVIDACMLAGMLPERTQEDIDRAEFSQAEEKRTQREDELRARVAAQREAKGIHTVELDSAKYFSTTSTDTTDEPVNAR